MAQSKVMQAIVEIAGNISPTLASSIKSAQKQLSGLNVKAIAVGAACAAGAVAVGKAVFKAGEYLADLGSQFDNVQDTIRIGTGATGDDLDALMDSFNKVYGSVPTTMEDASKTISDYNTRLGLTGENLEKISIQAIQVSDVLNEDLNSVIKSSSKALQEWNLETEDYGDAMDYVFKVSQSTGAGFTDLMNQLQTYGPQLQAAGYSFQEAAVLMGQVEKAGLDASTVMTGLRNAATAASKAGFDTVSEGLETYFERIQNADSETRALEMATNMFGAKAAPTMVKAIRDGTLSLSDLKEQLDASTESINKAAEDTYDYSEMLTILKNKGQVALQPLAESVFQMLNDFMPVLSELLDSFIPVINILTEKLVPIIEDIVPSVVPMIEDIIPVIADIATVLAGDVIPPVIEIIKDLLPSALSVVKGLLPIIEMLAKTVLPVIVNVIGAIMPVINEAVQTILPMLGQLLEGLMPIFDALMPVVNLLTEIIGGALTAAINAVQPVIDGLSKTIGGIVSFIKDVFTGNWEGAWDSVVNIFSGIWDTLVGYLKAPLTFLQGLWDGVKEIWSGAGDFFSNVWEGIKAPFVAVADWFGNIFSNAWQAVKNVFSAGGQVFEGIKEGIWDTLKTVINALISGINTVVALPFDGINWALEKIKSISILGLKPFDWINTIPVPQIPLLAKGGFTDGVSIAGEAGTEAVISFDQAVRDRNLDVWYQAGHMLGVLPDVQMSTPEIPELELIIPDEDALPSTLTYEAQAARLLDLEDFSLADLAGDTGNTYITYDFSGFTWAPNIDATGNGADDVMSKLREHEAEFFDWLRDFARMKEEARYA